MRTRQQRTYQRGGYFTIYRMYDHVQRMRNQRMPKETAAGTMEE